MPQTYTVSSFTARKNFYCIGDCPNGGTIKRGEHVNVLTYESGKKAFLCDDCFKHKDDAVDYGNRRIAKEWWDQD